MLKEILNLNIVSGSTASDKLRTLYICIKTVCNKFVLFLGVLEKLKILRPSSNIKPVVGISVLTAFFTRG